MKRYVLIILLFWVGTGIAQTKKWTLEECIDYGVEQSLQMQRQRLQNRNEQLSVRDAALSLIPSLNTISPYANFNYGRGIDPETNTFTNIENKTVGGFNVNAGMTLFSGFSGINRLRSAKISKLKGLKETENLANDLAIQIMNAFFNLMYAEESIRVTGEQVDNSSLQLKKMQREYELGRRPKSDLFNMQAQQASNEYQLIVCQNNRSNALINLKYIMNYQEEGELEVDVTTLLKMVPVSELSDAGSIFDKAMETLPEAIISRYNVRLYQLNLYATRASLYPTVSMNGGVSFGYYSNQSDGSFWSQVKDENRIGKSFGFTMNIPVFSGLGRRSNVSRAKNYYQDAQIVYRQKEQSVYKEIRQALLDLESVVQQYKLAEKKEEFSKLSYEAGKKRYEQGLGTIIDVNTTSNNLLQARYDLLKARMNYITQKRMVEFYKGVPLQTKVHE